MQKGMKTYRHACACCRRRLPSDHVDMALRSRCLTVPHPTATSAKVRSLGHTPACLCTCGIMSAPNRHSLTGSDGMVISCMVRMCGNTGEECS